MIDETTTLTKPYSEPVMHYIKILIFVISIELVQLTLSMLGFSRIKMKRVNGSQLAKMKKSIPDMSLP